MIHETDSRVAHKFLFNEDDKQQASWNDARVNRTKKKRERHIDDARRTRNEHCFWCWRCTTRGVSSFPHNCADANYREQWSTVSQRNQSHRVDIPYFKQRSTEPSTNIFANNRLYSVLKPIIDFNGKKSFYPTRIWRMRFETNNRYFMF